MNIVSQYNCPNIICGVAVPVVGAVLGVAGAVQQNNAARQQADAQRNSLDQQALVESNNTKLRLIELERQKLYSDFNFQIQTASREISKFSDNNALALATQQDLMNRQQQEYAVQSNVIQQQQQTLGLDQASAQTRFQSDIQSQGILAAELEQSRQLLTDSANQADALDRQQIDQERQRATGLAQYAASSMTGNGGRSVTGRTLSDRANFDYQDMMSQEQSAESLTRYQNLVDQVSQGRFNAEEVARLTSQYGSDEAAYLSQSAINSRDFLDSYQGFQLNDLRQSSSQTQAALSAAKSAVDSDYTIQEASQKLNQNYYDVQNKSQASTVQSSSASTQAAIATQRGGVQNPSSFGVLSSLVNGGLAVSSVLNQPSGNSISSYKK
jgi:hypothetical protein